MTVRLGKAGIELLSGLPEALFIGIIGILAEIVVGAGTVFVRGGRFLVIDPATLFFSAVLISASSFSSADESAPA